MSDRAGFWSFGREYEFMIWGLLLGDTMALHRNSPTLNVIDINSSSELETVSVA